MLAVLATAHTMASSYDAGVELAVAALATPDVSALGRVIAHRTAMLAAMSTGDLTSAREHAGTDEPSRVARVAPFERELRGFEAAILDRTGCTGGGSPRGRSHSCLDRGGRVTEIWARLVAAIIAMRAKQFDEARAQLERTPQLGGRQDVVGGAMLRAEGYLGASTPAAETLGGSRPTWRRAVEACGRLGDLGELALSFRAAAAVAERARARTSQTLSSTPYRPRRR